MDLHGIVSGAISAINPMVSATVQISTGYVTNADGSRTPSYAAAVSVQAQVQALTTRDLRQLDSLNIQGSQKTIYIRGSLAGLVRKSNKGGDLVTLPDGVWLVTAVLEQWPDWCKVAVTLQD